MQDSKTNKEIVKLIPSLAELNHSLRQARYCMFSIEYNSARALWQNNLVSHEINSLLQDLIAGSGAEN